MSRKRRARPSFDWQQVLDDGEEPTPAPGIRIPHTRLDLDESGVSSRKTTYIPAPASPAKGSQPVYYDDFNWNNKPTPLEPNTINDAYLDPAYQHFLDVNEPGPPRRKRTAEVGDSGFANI